MTADIYDINVSIAECSECGETNRWIIFLNRNLEISYFECASCGSIWELECDN